MKRRLKIYREINQEHNYILQDFFNEKNVDVLDVKVELSDDHIDTLNSFIKRVINIFIFRMVHSIIISTIKKKQKTKGNKKLNKLSKSKSKNQINNNK